MSKYSNSTRPPEYISWFNIIQRCCNTNNPAYHRYGGKGITICKEWRKSFHCFFADMGKRPTVQHSIDRINNNGNYEPANCRWASAKQQANNRKSNNYVTYKGTVYTIPELAEAFNISYNTLRQRIRRYGWTIEKAVTHNIKSEL